MSSVSSASSVANLMAKAGYIYALINPSLEGLVKIGKTTRDPTDRAKELSSSTAAPTPFVLAFDVYVEDCSEAEVYLHTLLQRRGYRVSENREFFNAPLKEIIKAMLEVEGSSAGPPPRTPTREKPRGGWEDILDEAQAYYHGEGETIEDKKQAFKLFTQAARLGAPDAFYALGIMYRDGEGCDQDVQEALEQFKKGVASGSDECHAEMALLFMREKHIENARKCWAKYFRSDSFAGGLNGHEAAYGLAYMTEALEGALPIDHRDELQGYADQIVGLADATISEAEPDAKPALKRRRRLIKRHLGVRAWL